jgi:hypothetical protein
MGLRYATLAVVRSWCAYPLSRRRLGPHESYVESLVGDSLHLAYVSGSALVISEPDGNAKRTIPIDGQAGLATPSPDGKSVTYLTFRSSPEEQASRFAILGRKHHLDSAAGSAGKTTAVTERNPATTYDLRWIDNHALVFDRFGDEVLPKSPRMWKVSVGSHSGLADPMK